VTFRASWERQSASNLDRRIGIAVALAPAPTVRAVIPDSLAAITTPVTIMVGEADRNSQLHFLGHDVGHYTLLCVGTEEGRRLEPEICIDGSGIDRHAVHEIAIRIARGHRQGWSMTT
jgi:hypothetical protein